MNRVTVGNRGLITKIDGYTIVWNHREDHNIIERSLKRADLDLHNINLKFLDFYKHFLNNKKDFKVGINFISFLLSDFYMIVDYNNSKHRFFIGSIMSKDMIKPRNRRESNFVLLLK